MDQSKCDHTCIAKANGDDANAAADADDADDEVNDEEDDAKKGRRWMLISSSNKDGHCNAKLFWLVHHRYKTTLSIQCIIILLMFMSMAVRLSGI